MKFCTKVDKDSFEDTVKDSRKDLSGRNMHQNCLSPKTKAVFEVIWVLFS